jgi:para-nitrobenzyl esterase
MESTVSTHYGKLVGLTQQGFTAFRGIPYAQPPVDALRFRAPQKLSPWVGVRDATRYPPSAIQEVSPMNPVGQTSEDCLYLNLWTPAADKKARPVMVWIHGGSFVSGSASMPQYDGSSLAKRGDVVVVGINYRLGLLGFAYLKERFGSRVGSNIGLRDQIAALEWIKENIADFGGDPENITLFGESAGAICIASLLCSPVAKGLFRNAIVQSGSPDYFLKAEEAERLRSLYWEKLELAKDDDIFTLPASGLLKAQRFAMKQGVQRGDYSSPMPLFGMPLVPVLGDDILPEVPLRYLADNATGVNLLLGTMSQEWNYFLKVPMGPKGSVADKYSDLDVAGLQKLMERALPGAGEAAMLAYYHSGGGFDEGVAGLSGKLLDLYGDFESDKAFGVPSVRLAENQAQLGGKVYHYLCSWDKGPFGAAHAADIPLVFGCVDSGIGKMFTGGGEGAQRLSNTMQDAWLAFARTGDPSCAALGQWPCYEKDTRFTMELGEKCTLHKNVREIENNFWKGRI